MRGQEEGRCPRISLNWMIISCLPRSFAQEMPKSLLQMWLWQWLLPGRKYVGFLRGEREGARNLTFRLFYPSPVSTARAKTYLAVRDPFPWMMINTLGNVIGLIGREERPKLQPGLLLKVLKPRPVHEPQTEASGRAPCSQVPGQMEPSCFPPRPGAWHLALRGSKRWGTVAVQRAHVGFSDSGLLGPRLRRGRVRASDNS